MLNNFSRGVNPSKLVINMGDRNQFAIGSAKTRLAPICHQQQFVIGSNFDSAALIAPVNPSPEVRSTRNARPGTTQFSADGDWIFASPLKLGRLPYSYTGFWRELERAAAEAGIGHLGTHAFRHTYRSWLSAVGTPMAVQQKLMRHSDIRTTMNIYGDVVTNEMGQAHSKVVGLALSRSA